MQLGKLELNLNKLPFIIKLRLVHQFFKINTVIKFDRMREEDLLWKVCSGFMFKCSPIIRFCLL